MRKTILVFLFLLPTLVQAQMYRWTDENGKVHYSDSPPPASAKNVQKKNLSAGSGSQAPLPYALQEAVKSFPVTLYTNDDCKEVCAQARDLLNKRGVPYKEISVVDKQAMDNFKKLTGGTSFPVMTVGRETTKGFANGVYHAALDNGGYPRESLLPKGTQARQLVKPVEKVAPAGETQAEAPQSDANAPK